MGRGSRPLGQIATGRRRPPGHTMPTKATPRPAPSPYEPGTERQAARRRGPGRGGRRRRGSLPAATGEGRRQWMPGRVRSAPGPGATAVVASGHGDSRIATGLQFPEGPVALADGNVLLVEIAGARSAKIGADGAVDVVAELGGGPERRRPRPRRGMYICNNGGCFSWDDVMGLTVPGPVPPTLDGRLDPAGRPRDRRGDHALHRVVERPAAGARTTSCSTATAGSGSPTTACATTAPATAPASTTRWPTGRSCSEVIFPLDAPNGIGLSPDGSGSTWPRPTPAGSSGGPSTARARCADNPVGHGGHLLAGLPGIQLFDSLAVDGEGWVCVGTLVNGGITAISPDGATIEHIPLPDPLVTNICFGGPTCAPPSPRCPAPGSWSPSTGRARACAPPRTLTRSGAGMAPPVGASVPSAMTAVAHVLRRDPRVPQEPGRLRQAGGHLPGRRHAAAADAPRPPTSWSSTPAPSSRRPARSRSTSCSPWPTARATTPGWWSPGCMAERYGDELAAALPEVDAVAGFGVPVTLGPQARRPAPLPSFDLLNLPRPASTAPWAYVKVAEGCDRACGFCAIPSFRGPQRSRSIDADPRPRSTSWSRWRAGDRARRPGPGQLRPRPGRGRRNDRPAGGGAWRHGSTGAPAVPVPVRPHRRARSTRSSPPACRTSTSRCSTCRRPWCAACAAGATATKFLGRIEADPRRSARGRVPLELHRRLPRRDRGRPRPAARLRRGGPARLVRLLRLLAARTAPTPPTSTAHVPPALMDERLAELRELQDAITAARRDDSMGDGGRGAGGRPRHGPQPPRGARDRRHHHRARRTSPSASSHPVRITGAEGPDSHAEPLRGRSGWRSDRRSSARRRWPPRPTSSPSGASCSRCRSS